MTGEGSYEDTADALYGLPPEEFTAARTAAVKAARAGGDRDLAARLQALRRPTVVGWLANQLVRTHPDQMTEMVALGGRLREATSALDRDAMRALASDQQRLVRALVRQAFAVAAAAGRRVGDDAQRELEETLHAALADPDAATQLMGGRLVDGLQHSGFPLLSGPAAAAAAIRPADASAREGRREDGPATRPAAPPASRTPDDSGAAEAQLREARAALSRARSEEQTADEARAAAAASADTARAAVDDAASQLARLREEVRAVTALLATAERDSGAAAAALERAERDAAAAVRRREKAERRLAALGGNGRG